MPLNGKFLAKYGKNWLDMDDSERSMAVMSEIFDLRESVEPVKDLCETSLRHKIYFRWIAGAITLIAIPVLLMLVRYILTGAI